MTTPSNPAKTGTVGGVSVVADAGAGLMHTILTSVTIGATAYVRNPPPGHPIVTPSGQSAAKIGAATGTIAAGTTITLPAAEAAALVAAGFATSNGPVAAGKAGG